MPFSLLYLALFLAALGMLMVLVQLGLVTMTFEKLGLSQDSAFLLLFLSLFGSAINLPLFSLRSRAPPRPVEKVFYGLLRGPRLAWSGRTLVTVNVGGGLIPVLFSFYLFGHTPVGIVETVVATVIVAAVSYRLSRPLPAGSTARRWPTSAARSACSSAPTCCGCATFRRWACRRPPSAGLARLTAYSSPVWWPCS